MCSELQPGYIRFQHLIVLYSVHDNDYRRSSERRSELWRSAYTPKRRASPWRRTSRLAGTSGTHQKHTITRASHLQWGRAAKSCSVWGRIGRWLRGPGGLGRVRRVWVCSGPQFLAPPKAFSYKTRRFGWPTPTRTWRKRGRKWIRWWHIIGMDDSQLYTTLYPTKLYPCPGCSVLRTKTRPEKLNGIFLLLMPDFDFLKSLGLMRCFAKCRAGDLFGDPWNKMTISVPETSTPSFRPCRTGLLPEDRLSFACLQQGDRHCFWSAPPNTQKHKTQCSCPVMPPWALCTRRSARIDLAIRLWGADRDIWGGELPAGRRLLRGLLK